MLLPVDNPEASGLLMSIEDNEEPPDSIDQVPVPIVGRPAFRVTAFVAHKF